MSDLKVSIVVPVYNAQNTLDKCVNSILSQSLNDVEILLINDGSKDSSPALCDAYAQKYKNIKVFHKENGGVSSARNLGIEMAEGEFVGFVDSDDYIDSTMFEKLYNAAIKYQAGVAVCGRVRKSQTSESFYPLNRKEKVIDNITALKLLICDGGFDNACYNKIFKAELIKTNPFPSDIKINEELMPIFKCIEATRNIALVDEILYTVDTSGASATRAAFSEKFLHTLTVAKRLIEACDKYEGLSEYAQMFETVASMDVIRRCITDKQDWRETAERIRNDLLRDYKVRKNNPIMQKSHKIKLFTLKLGLKPYRFLLKLVYKI